MKKTFIFAVLFILMLSAAAGYAAPDLEQQFALIAGNADLWKQDVDFGMWGYAVTDLDHNGRLEIIAASVQGTGFYTYMNVFEVDEEGTGLIDIYGPFQVQGKSAPDIMVSAVPTYFDKESGRYYYIFEDYIRNGMAENYQNKRAVSIADGKWEEALLAEKATIYTDAEHYTITCTNSAGNPISEAQYDGIVETVYGNLEQSETCINWQMTDNEAFAALTPAQLIESLHTAAENTCRKD